MEAILSELTVLFKGLPTDAAVKATAALDSHNRIFVYAAGRSGLMLRAFAMRLAQMGRTVYVVGETVTTAIAPGDLLVLASASGSTRSVCCCAQIAKDVGADLFVISANAVSALSAIHPVDILLPAATKNCSKGSAQIMGSLFEQALLLFCDSVVARFPDAGSAVHRHANLE